VTQVDINTPLRRTLAMIAGWAPGIGLAFAEELAGREIQALRNRES
jgi:hypothetical protein